MSLGDVVDKLHDEHSLTNAGAAEKADLTAFAVRLEKVNHLDAGRKDFGADRKVLELRGGLVNGLEILAVEGRKVVNGVADDVHQASLDLVAGRNGDGMAHVNHGKSATEAVGRFHCDTAHGVFTDMLFDLEDKLSAVLTVDFESRVDGRQYHAFAFKGHIDHRADNLGYFAGILAHCVLRGMEIVI